MQIIAMATGKRPVKPGLHELFQCSQQSCLWMQRDFSNKLNNKFNRLNSINTHQVLLKSKAVSSQQTPRYNYFYCKPIETLQDTKKNMARLSLNKSFGC